MRGRFRRLREWATGGTGGPTNDLIGLLAGLALLGTCIAADIVLTQESAALVGTFVAAPFVAALFARPAVTGVVAAVAIAAAALSTTWNEGTGDSEQVVRMIVISIGGLIAVGGAWLRWRSAGRSERLQLLDSVGAVADGSLPLAETLRRVTDVIVPAFSDICLVDAIHDGRVSRIATRVQGPPDAAAIQDRMRRRPPKLPAWLVKVERSWRDIPEWWPRIRDEELQRMAHSPDDLDFLRSLKLRSSVVVPIRARDRNLGALTLLTAWSGRRYGAEDVRFAQILASRIGLALDNAGLFSDLESIERRMDTVMSILDEAIVIHGTDGELIFANPAAARMLGYDTVAEAVAAPTAEIRERYEIRDEQGNPVTADQLVGRQALDGMRTEAQTLRTTDRATGIERWTQTRAQGIEGPDGEILYSVTAIEDVTDVRRAEFANRLLARTGELISPSVDYRATIERVPELLVPEFADWCSIEIPGEGGILDRVAMAHHDPARLDPIHALRERYPLPAQEPSRIGDVLTTGESQVIQVTDAWLQEVAVDADHLRLLREIAMKSVLAVPMSAGGTVAGALVFVNHDGARRFDDHDRVIAEEVARRVALAIESARLADERAHVADALQRELLPPSLPSMPGWEVATMYEPAGEVNEVGGDFYEVFPVSGGWAVLLGDVSGKGAAAAALTAEARHTIRTAGMLTSDPIRGLEVLDRSLRERDEVALCSVAMLVLPDGESATDEVSVILAGHPYPILIHQGGRAEPVGKTGPLLGVVDEPAWPRVTLSLDPGDQLVLYTDGVIEARGEDGGERFGTERLRQGLAGCVAPDDAVERVRDALWEFGARARDDDAALVAIRRTGDGPRLGGSAMAVGSGAQRIQ
jgi:PAS domain S-box-containing protein